MEMKIYKLCVQLLLLLVIYLTLWIDKASHYQNSSSGVASLKKMATTRRTKTNGATIVGLRLYLLSTAERAE
jgi:hypothetical protein